MMMRCLLLSMLLVVLALPSYAQSPTERTVDHTMEGWLGLYTKYRIKPGWYYYGEYHYRRRDYFREMANVYLRFGVTHIPNPSLEFTAGIVTPLYWAKGKDLDHPNLDLVTMQFRFWQQMLSVMRFDRFKLYHQIRLEQRWAKDNFIDAQHELTFRFRYKLSTYVPLNNHHLVPGTLFFSGYEEIFMQTGKSILFNHFEDNRLFLGLGYIINEQMQVQAGYMWTYRHSGDPYHYQSRHVPRISLYHNLDFHSLRERRLRREQTPVLDHEF